VKRTLMVLTVALLMAVVLVVTVAPVFALDPSGCSRDPHTTGTCHEEFGKLHVRR
jgi:hypothetical protein